MKVINVYEQYFGARGEFNGVVRRGAKVMLVSTSDAGTILYEAAVTFFPHVDAEDFAVSYDAYFSKELYSGAGRRSKKREEMLLTDFQAQVDGLAAEQGAQVLWNEPLSAERRG